MNGAPDDRGQNVETYVEDIKWVNPKPEADKPHDYRKLASEAVKQNCADGNAKDPADSKLEQLKENALY